MLWVRIERKKYYIMVSPVALPQAALEIKLK
jgi:hypothetical protein